MGKKRAVARGSTSPTHPQSAGEEYGAPTEAVKIREEANKSFGRKEYAKALDAYERALKVTLDDGEDKALLHSNKAACYMMQQKFKEAVNECTSALDSHPSYHRALVRRAKAYEQMGHFKQALSDIQKANKADTANPDTQETEKRLKDLVAGKKSAATASANGISKKSQLGRTSNRLVVTAKCVLNGETRMVHLMGSLNYAEVLQAVKEKFPHAGPFILKYLDREGDLVTITDKADVHKALQELVEAAERKQGNQHGPRLHAQNALPPLHLQLTPVTSEDDVPKPPVEEQLALEQFVAAKRAFQASALQQTRKANEQATAEAAQAEAAPMNEGIDQWLIDFAGLFREQLNIEPDRHLDLTGHAWDSLQAAMDAAVADERAVELFDQAWKKFQEVSASGQIQMGNVALAMGKRLVDKAVAAGEPVSGVEKQAFEQFDRADGRYKEALRISPTMYDASVSMANLEFERGKVALGLAILNARPLTEEEKQDPKAEEKAQAAQMAAVEEGLSKIKPEGMEAAEPYFERTWKELQTALDMLPEEQKGQKLPPPRQESEQAQPQEEDSNPWAHCMVVWGNLLYEQSQFRAAVDGDWKAPLEQAYKNFKAAGCPDTDIRTAMQAHARSKEIDFMDLSPPAAASASADSEAGKEGAAAAPQENGQAANGHAAEDASESGSAGLSSFPIDVERATSMAAPSETQAKAAPEGSAPSKDEGLVEGSAAKAGEPPKEPAPKGLPSLGRPKNKKGADKAQETA
ncbi:hypothetical protein WJX73_001707 [Symbiochloris irregularis]|uniref:PB1 domain-containing protein n=1 Tax=Symbiochloris irregularis TaxID=706552 RepID=A0AAW1NV06_9CHLO